MSDDHAAPPGPGTDQQLTPERPHPLAHSEHPQALRLTRSRKREPNPVVGYSQAQMRASDRQPEPYPLGLGMMFDVAERLLSHSQQAALHVRAPPAHLVRAPDLDGDLSPRGKPLGQVFQCRDQPFVV